MKRRLILGMALALAATHATAREANHLQGAASPYLLQHLYNPVDWYPWGTEALDKAKQEGKLIFISVGYSSCHWCHVMEDESFENDAIADLLNADFVSIKIDRETRPDLDERFMAVTQFLTGGGGWPNSVFLTPDGDPFLAGGYFPPDDFKSIIAEARHAWRDDPAQVRARAANVASAVSRLLARKAAARAVTPEAARRAAARILEQTDIFNGGYGVAPKFPREPLFLFLLDEAGRSGDREVLQAVTDMLDGMIQGGIHDHVGGGFHRYAVDPEWHVPHFEKMLYTQAMTGRLLVRAWSITGAPRYRNAAERAFDYVLRELRDPGGGFYSAQDADSLNPAGENAEGAYYVWTPQEIAQLEDSAAFLRRVFRIESEGNFEAANVLSMKAPPAELAASLGLDPAAFAARLERALDDLYALRSSRPPPFLDRKIVLSWNAMMIATLAEAGYLLDKAEYYLAAEASARFILDEMRPREGLQRIWFDGSAGIPAQLPDFAGLGLAFVALHDYAPDTVRARRWLAGARDLADALRARFGHAAEGFRVVEESRGLSTQIPVNDTEIPSGNALALMLFARLAHRAQLPEIEQDAFLLAAALSGLAPDAPQSRGFALMAIRELQHGATGPVRHAAKGAVRIEHRRAGDGGAFGMDIRVADGWHVNAHRPLQDYLVPTELVVEGMPGLAVTYPDPVNKSLAFNDEPLALYQGDLRIHASGTASPRRGNGRRAVLTLQACSDEICLQPEELLFIIWN